MIYYLDTNVILSMLVEDALSDKVDAWLNLGQRLMLVSVWAETEVFDVLLRQSRSGELTEIEANTAFADYHSWFGGNALQLDLSPVAGQIALSLARDASLKLSAPDSLHLGLAIASKSVLVTFDIRLADAARSRGHPVTIP